MVINTSKCLPHVIRNEKVGCSIHLSGTKQKTPLRSPEAGFFHARQQATAR